MEDDGPDEIGPETAHEHHTEHCAGCAAEIAANTAAIELLAEGMSDVADDPEGAEDDADDVLDALFGDEDE